MIESLAESTTNVMSQEVLVLFTAASHHYVTPSFYTETKPTTAKVVPTWNYAAVQAYGQITVYHDSKCEIASEFLSKQTGDLSQHTEKSIMGYTGEGDRPEPWKVSDAPSRYIDLMKKNIIVIEIRLHRLEGKFKMSQEMRKGDREGVVAGFQSMGSDVGRCLAGIVQERDELKEAKAS